MGDRRVTLESLTAPNLDQPGRAVLFLALDEGVKFELKTGVVHLLPKFSGLRLRILFVTWTNFWMFATVCAHLMLLKSR